MQCRFPLSQGWVVGLALCALVAPVFTVSELSLPFGLDANLAKPRFSSYAGAKARDIRVFVMKNISENTPVGTVLDTFKAHDKDMPGFNYTFRINRESDPKRQFTIDQDGTLKVNNLLDREDIPVYRLIIEAFDAAGNVGSQLVMVYLQDVNDNGPIPYTVPDPCIFMENTVPEAQPVCEIRATDKDTAEFGPPFNMQINPAKWKYEQYLSVVFDIHGDGGNGSMVVRPLVKFDREAEVPGKILEIPLILKDVAGKTNEQSVYIIIGDENDNPMNDGKVKIHVNSYLGKLKQTMIGSVYVDDKDDWDRSDKTFSWKKGLPGFDLSPLGEITMAADKPAGRYDLVAEVVDRVRNERAEGEVTVIVNHVPQQAFDNQGAIQLLLSPSTTMQNPSDFIRPDSRGVSPMDTFKSELAKYIGSPVTIDVFSVKVDRATLQTGWVPVLNVRFAAHGQPYKDPAMLNGLLAAHREELQGKLGTIVVGVGIDMCKFTTCDNGCQTINTADFEGLVVSANTTVLVGVNANSQDKCECPVWKAPTQCKQGLCHNDGVCHNTFPGFFCECRNDLLKGMRCQGTSRSFNGDGFAWYKPMPACTSLQIALRFMTNTPDGVLLYNGPMEADSEQFEIEYRDYIIIQLKNGLVQLEMNMNGQAASNITVASESSLADGKWHSIHVTQNGRNIELVVDECKYLTSGNTDADSTCRATLVTKDDDERLNIATPVQIGGLVPLSGQRYPAIVNGRPGMKGCIRNLMINNDQYDLATPAYDKNSQAGCKLWGGACDANTIDAISHCVHGDCFADVGGAPKCICDPGYGGDRCEKKLEWIQFGPGASLDYHVNVELQEQVTDVELLFIPGKSTGNADMTYGGDGKQSYVATSIEGGIPSAKIDLYPTGAGSGQHTAVNLRIPEMNGLKENSSYWMQLSRNPTRAQLSIDGAYYAEEGLDPQRQSFSLAVTELLLGSQGGGRGFQGCVGTFRWDKIQLPLVKPAQPKAGELITISSENGVSQGCSLRITCSDLPVGFCGGSFVCVDFWKGPFCTCSDGANAILGDDGQVVGCGATLAVAKLGISNPAIILILVSLVLLIMLVLLMVIYSRRQTAPFESVRPEDMNRDNLRPYDVEGGGEADNDQYSIANLRKPVMPIDGNGMGPVAPPIYSSQRPPMDDRLRSQLNDLDADPNAAPYDELRIFQDERDNISVVTLESIESEAGANPGGPNWGSRFE